MDARTFLTENNRLFDVVIIDLPDPKTIDIARLYSLQFYKLVYRQLSMGGVIVTQATSPYFSREAFICILNTITGAGFNTLPYHNHVPTLGEWGWVLGQKNPRIDQSQLKIHLSRLTFEDITTKFLNQNAMISMINFGKGIFDNQKNIKINDEMDLSLYRYYRDGGWGVY
jgi:spermidine synthase